LRPQKLEAGHAEGNSLAIHGRPAASMALTDNSSAFVEAKVDQGIVDPAATVATGMVGLRHRY